MPGPMTAPEIAPRSVGDLAAHAWRTGQDHAACGRVEEAVRWLRRARRLAPRDPMVAFTLATALLRAGEAAEAAALFAGLGETQGTADAWAGLAAAHRALGESRQAEGALGAALAAAAPTGAVRGLADSLATEGGWPGWCGLDAAGQLHLGGGSPDQLLLDGRPVSPGEPLPPGWQRARTLAAARGGRAFLGSPLRPAEIARTEGVVWEAAGGGVEGWAWHPADPAHAPELLVVSAGRTSTLVARAPAEALPGRPFSRPRRVAVPPVGTGQPVQILDAAGRDLLGSPLYPGAEQRPAPTPARTPRRAAPSQCPAVDVIVPVYRDRAATLACLGAVLDTVPPGVRVWVVDDASPEPDLAAAVDALAAAGRVRLIRHARNRGFPAAANAGLRAAGRRDAVLLNSDALVPPGWLERLREAAYAAPDVGSATPLSNDASLASYPAPASPPPDLAGTHALDCLARRANCGLTVDVPTGVGFCLYLRRDCLDHVGPLREDLFAQGYGEENDWCLRAGALGWRHVVAADAFVAHAGGASFGAAREHLLRRNLAVLNRLHPGYDARIAAFEATDPLAPPRRRLDSLRWRAGAREGAAILVTHEGGGGVDRVIARRCGALETEGRRPIVLRPKQGLCLVADGAATSAYPNLLYRLPGELPQLVRLLRADRPAHVELHHLLGHGAAVLDLAAALRVPYDCYIHDYAWFCPRISLLGRGRRYCGEPGEAGCEACVAALGSRLNEALTVRALRARSGRVLGGARRVVAPSEDAATRLRRHFPQLRPAVEPWEPEPAPALPAPRRGGSRFRVAAVGAIGAEKGYDVLLACAHDARARGLPLEFVVVGHTSDDARLLAAGPVFVTGRYDEGEGAALVRAQGADLVFLPSIWPETWCFALTVACEAGLPAAVFDIGAPAERVRRTGRGWVLPLGLPAERINAALLDLAGKAPLAPGAQARHSPALAATEMTGTA